MPYPRVGESGLLGPVSVYKDLRRGRGRGCRDDAVGVILKQTGGRKGNSIYSRDRLSATCWMVLEELRPLIHRRYGAIEHTTSNSM